MHIKFITDGSKAGFSPLGLFPGMNETLNEYRMAEMRVKEGARLNRGKPEYCYAQTGSLTRTLKFYKL